jgi:hypothetical protein
MNNKMNTNKNFGTRLHAYNESPMLRNEMGIVKNPTLSRKAINFD